METAVAGRGLGGVVTFTGYRSDVDRLLGALDVVVLPSLYEGMPLVVLEALAMGKAVVATAVDGTTEVIKNGETGLLVPPADAGSLGRAIGSFLEDPALALRCGEAGSGDVRQRFTLDQMVRRTMAVYCEALGSPSIP
jgi:glycosyltransferase involved in cell wall biosynthesis